MPCSATLTDPVLIAFALSTDDAKPKLSTEKASDTDEACERTVKATILEPEVPWVDRQLAEVSESQRVASAAVAMRTAEEHAASPIEAP